VSFAVVPPAMLGLRIMLFGLRQGKPTALSRRVLVPGIAAVVIGLFVTAIAFNVARLAHAESYGGGFLESAAVSLDPTTLVNLAVLALAGGSVLPFLLAGFFVEVWKRGWWSSNSRTWIAGCAVVSLLILPQLILYRRYGGFTIDRYLLPAGLGVAAGVAAATVWSLRLGQRMTFLAVTSVWVIMLSYDSVSTWRDAERFRVDSVQLGRMVQAVSQAPPHSTIAIAADPVRDLESTVSLPFHVAAGGRPDLDMRVLLTRSDSPDVPSAVQALAAYFPERTDVGERGCADLAVVVLFAPQAQAIEALPCLAAADFRLESFSETVRLPDFAPSILTNLMPPTITRYSLLRRIAS
jgi:hypothetical protein